MKILHLYKSYYPETLGGVEKGIYTLSEALSDKGFQSAVLTTTHQDQSYEEKVGNSTVYYFPISLDIASCPMSVSMLLHFKKIVNQFDILHCHFPWPFADLLCTISSIKKPIIVTYHSDIVKQKFLKIFYSPLMKHFLKKVNLIIPTSENYLNTSSILKNYRNKTVVIPMGINRDDDPKPSLDEIETWQNKVGNNFFLFVGVLRYYKGLHFLLEAVKGTDIPIVIAGIGPEEKFLLQKAKSENINNVHFVGKISEKDKITLYKLCKAVIASSHLRSEALCLSLVEGLAYGKPLISTEIGTGTSFVNLHNETGIVVPPENPQALKEAMEKIRDDEKLSQYFSQNAEKRYEEIFHANKVASLYAECYREIS